MRHFLLFAAAIFAIFACVAADGENLGLDTCSAGNSEQTWTFSPTAKEIVLTENSACLDVQNYGTNAGATVWAYSPCHPDDKDPAHQNESWDLDDTKHTITEVMSGKCLDATDTTTVVINDCSGAATQQWTYDSTTKLLHHTASGKCLGLHKNVWVWPCSAEPSKSMPFCDESLSIDDRVADLVANLTQAEKVVLFSNNAKSVPRLNIGDYQWWSEALHGVAGSPGVRFGGILPNATSFPEPILSAASFNKSLFTAIGAAVGLEGRAFFNQGRAGLTFWTPNINIIRDPRWGRGQETPGEDPFLTSAYAQHFITAFQTGSDPNILLASSCAKHYAFYDLENWHGVDRHHFNAVVNAQDTADTYLPAFQAAVELAHVSGIMCSYNEENGVPSCANKELLTTTARGKWQFDGYITSDCGAVNDVYSTHKYASTKNATCEDVLEAGMDIDCGAFLGANLAGALDGGSVAMEQVDTALKHLFRVQFRLGLFTDPAKNPYSAIPPTVVDSMEHRQLALSAAQQGIVLLKNSGALPLSADTASVAVVGPSGNATHLMQGNYNGIAPYLISPLMGIQTYVPSATFTQGCDVSCTDDKGFSAAVAAASSADATVMVIGLDEGQESEGHDRDIIGLPGNQNALVTQVAAAAKAKGHSVTVVIMAGGPVDITAVKENNDVDAIVWVGYPGQSGGQALANVLFGAFNPAGRLPYTLLPSAFTAFTMFDMGMRPNATSGNPGHTYRFYNGSYGTPAYSFGDGMSYTTFTQSVSVEKAEMPKDALQAQLKDATASKFDASPMNTITVKVTNTGKRSGDYVALCFVAPPAPGVNGAPLKSLRGFDRIFLLPGETKTVSFPVSAYDFAYADANGQFVTSSGDWTVSVDDAAATVTIA